MKKSMFRKSLFAVVLGCFVALSLNAQSDAAPVSKVQKTEKKQAHEGNLSSELNLTEKQKAEFKKIDSDYAEKSKEARAARKEDKAKMREDRIRAHKAVLTPEQAAKYDEILAKREKKHQERQQKKATQKQAKKEKKAEKKALKKELKKQ